MLKQLQYFVSIVETHSFTLAAEEHYISQSAISQQIKQLESELGVQLIKRKNRSFELTPAGDYFYRHGKALLKEYESIKKETIKLGEDQELTLTIGYPKSYDGEELQQAVLDFTGIYPEVKISFVVGNHEALFHQLVSNDIDIKLSEQRRLFNQDYYNYELKYCNSYIEISSKDPLSQQDKIEIKDLKNRTCIIIADADAKESETTFFNQTLNIANQFLYADSLSQARMMVSSNRGFLLVDEIGHLSSPKPGIVRIPLYHKGEPMLRNYFFCWKKEKTNYYIEEFVDLFRKILNQ